MVKSMTGFGKATAEINEKKITVEIRSLNSKQADVAVRMPSHYKEKEIRVRSLINQELERGKIEFNLYAELMDTANSLTINKALFKQYYNDFHSLLEDVEGDSSKTDLVSIITKIPDVLKSERQELDKNEWLAIEKIIEAALEAINQFRSDEGGALAAELSTRIKNIEDLLAQVEPFEKERIITVRERISNNLKDSLGEENVNQDRLEQELIFYLEKLDITEEKTRLTTHCNYFIETLNDSKSQGKKLGFITQEIGREINTLGSKANHAEIQKIVVKMKDELEKIKEQNLNIL